METNEISEAISFEELLELPVKRIDQYLHCLKMIREYVCQRQPNLRRSYDDTFLKFLGFWNFVKLPSSSIKKRMEVAQLQEMQFGGNVFLVPLQDICCTKVLCKNVQELREFGKTMKRISCFFSSTIY